MDLDTVKSKFVARKGFFEQPYKSIRLENCEITIENLLDQYQLSVCSPYNEKLDRLTHKEGVGAGEVLKSWFFDTEKEIYNFVISENMLK